VAGWHCVLEAVGFEETEHCSGTARLDSAQWPHEG